MPRYLSGQATEEICRRMFASFGNSSEEVFLQKELERYVPQMASLPEEEIVRFMDYQRDVYINGSVPIIGRPIASTNPKFLSSINSLLLASPDVYTMASIKENGYRMQLHIGKNNISAFSRQFVPYDLRMFPELFNALEKLPVMIGDVELINKHHTHLAGFNRLQNRIPQDHWPRKGQNGLTDEMLRTYLSNPDFFEEDLQVTLVFHGLFAISDVCYWDRPRAEQQRNSLVSLCKLPLDYSHIDLMLNLLEKFNTKNGIDVKIVQRISPENHGQLGAFIEEAKKQKLEGVCIAQSFWQGNETSRPTRSASFKFKNYETIDCALLGLYLFKKEDGLKEENIKGALVGLFDVARGIYLPMAKVNLDPEGVQIKTDDQKERLIRLRHDIAICLKGVPSSSGKIWTLQDVFLSEGSRLIKVLFAGQQDVNLDLPLEEILLNLPRGYDLLKLFDLYIKEKEQLSLSQGKKLTVAKAFLFRYLDFFKSIENLDRPKKKRFFDYFGRSKKIKDLSAKLVTPQFLVSTDDPILLEVMAFDLKYGDSPHPAGFHSWYGDSFCVTNCFAERMRPDKNITTEYGILYDLLGKYTPSKRNKVKKFDIT